MPFTTAHPAIVVPLKKIWPSYLSLTGLMSGSMSPDLLYFLNLTTIHRGFSHSWSGLFYFCLPAGLAFSFAFHWLFKYHFLTNLPAPLDNFFSGLAVSRFKPRSRRDWTVLTVSVLIGALSHFFWDSFTHTGGELAGMIPLLTRRVTIFGGSLPLTAVAQHASTLIGFTTLALFLSKGNIIPLPQPESATRRSAEKLRFWAAVGAFSVLFAYITVMLTRRYYPGSPVPEIAIWGVSSWAGMFYGVAIYTVLKKLPIPQSEATSELSEN